MRKVNILITCLVVCLFMSACTSNTSQPSTATPLPTSTVFVEDSLITTSGSFFALSVADIKASAEWYSEKLGLEVTLQMPNASKPTVIVLEGGGLMVELIQAENGVSLSEIAPELQDKTQLHGIFKAGIFVDDLQKTIEILQERNVNIAFGPFPATNEQRANLIITDHEGNFIQFIER